MGSYADSLLTEGEVVIVRERQHWLALLLTSRVALALWVISAVLLLAVLLFSLDGSARTILGWMALITIAAGLVVLLYRWWNWRTEEYLVTNRRLLKVSGIFNKRSGDSNLEKINDAILEENLIGRLLNYGDLDILTAAEIAVDRYRMLHHAKDFKKTMLVAKHHLEDGVYPGGLPTPPLRSAPAPSAPAPSAHRPNPPGASAPSAPARAETTDDVAETLTKLAGLRDAGAITEAEYDAKKQELLGRL
jgi:hypothetical protein